MNNKDTYTTNKAAEPFALTYGMSDELRKT